MTIRRAEDAELEPKEAAVMVRCGHAAKALVTAAAAHQGVSLNRYVRQAAVRAALLDTAHLPPAADVAPVADNG